MKGIQLLFPSFERIKCTKINVRWQEGFFFTLWHLKASHRATLVRFCRLLWEFHYNAATRALLMCSSVSAIFYLTCFCYSRISHNLPFHLSWTHNRVLSSSGPCFTLFVPPRLHSPQFHVFFSFFFPPICLCFNFILSVHKSSLM